MEEAHKHKYIKKMSVSLVINGNVSVRVDGDGRVYVDGKRVEISRKRKADASNHPITSRSIRMEQGDLQQSLVPFNAWIHKSWKIKKKNMIY